MAGRPPKESIDFAGWNADIFDNEPKIDKLMDSQGCVGFTTYFFLCQKAYGSNGYFYPWCFDDSATTARKIGGGASASSVEETVKLCFRVGLLNEELYDRWKILTSRGVQKNYAKVALTRTNKSVISEYWLLSDEESEGLVKVALKQGEKRNIPPHNSIMPPHNPHFSGSKVKESIEEDTTVEDRKGEAPPVGSAAHPAPCRKRPKGERPSKHRYGEYQHILLTDAEYQRFVQEVGQERTNAAVKHLDEYIEMKGYKANNHNLAIRKWVFKALDEEHQRQNRAGGRNQASRSGNLFLDIAKEKGYVCDE